MRFCIAVLAALLVAVQAPAQQGQAEPGGATEIPAQFTGEWEGEIATPRWLSYVHISLGGAEDRAGTLRGFGQTIPLVAPEIDGEALTVSLDGPWSITPRIQLRPSDAGLVGEWQEEEARYPIRLGPVPIFAAPADRQEAWLQDLETLETRFLRVDRSFDAAAEQGFREQLAAIRSALPDLTDGEIMIGISRAIALAGNAHTRLYLLRNRTVFRRLPVRFWWFGGQLRIVSATPDHAGLLGCRVDRIGVLGVAAAHDRAAAATSGNAAWARYKSTYLLSSPESLQGLGVIADENAPVPLTLSDCDGAGSMEVSPLPLARSDEPVEAWWNLSPHFAERSGRRQYLQGRETDLPLYLRQSGAVHWFARGDDPSIFYVQFNRVERMADQDFGDFSEALLAALRAEPTRALIIDLRFNTGGNASLFADLIENLQAESAGMRRYVIIGRATFSAGILLAAQLQAAGNLTLVGEGAGDGLDYWAEGGNIILPNIGVNAHFANGAHRYSGAPCPDENFCLQLDIADLDPDIPASLTWDDYRAGRDPALEGIMADLERLTAPD